MTTTKSIQSEVTPAAVAALVGKIIQHHEVVIDGEVISIDKACLAYVCLACESIAMCSDPADVLPMRAAFVLECCGPENTVYPTF